MTMRRVLVMDDDSMILEVIASLLECLGYEATTCTNGEEAVEAYRQSMDQHIPFVAVILDQLVEHGMGGIDAAKAILALDPFAKLVLSSGYSDDLPCNSLFKRLLAKPYTLDELEIVLADL